MKRYNGVPYGDMKSVPRSPQPRLKRNGRVWFCEPEEPEDKPLTAYVLQLMSDPRTQPNRNGRHLNDTQVGEVRRMLARGATNRDIANTIGCSTDIVYRIKMGRSYKNVKKKTGVIWQRTD